MELALRFQDTILGHLFGVRIIFLLFRHNNADVTLRSIWIRTMWVVYINVSALNWSFLVFLPGGHRSRDSADRRPRWIGYKEKGRSFWNPATGIFGIAQISQGHQIRGICGGQCRAFCRSEPIRTDVQNFLIQYNGSECGVVERTKKEEKGRIKAQTWTSSRRSRK